MKVNDDRIILDKTVADQVSIWKRSKGFTDALVLDHVCSGETCSYHQIGDVFVCEKTGNVHGRIFLMPMTTNLCSLSNLLCIVQEYHC